ncbi:MAG: acyltransferase [Lachnospiraceae bacterium]|nr:acyltransferase [Lachnospiraceae bacterium]
MNGFKAELSGLNLLVGVLGYAVFNVGVTCFVLISGYFGITLKRDRILQLDLLIIFYSLLSILYSGVSGDGVSAVNVISALFPVTCRRYWFMTCYMQLALLSPFINQIPEKMKKENYEKLLGVGLLIFSVLPTIIFTTGSTSSGSGKRLENMILIYLIGRYIRLYADKRRSRKKLLTASAVCLLLTFLPNIVLSLYRGECTSNFARDCSLTVILSAIMIFLLFKEIPLYSPLVNSLAKHVMAAYVFEETVRTALGKCFDISVYVGSPGLIAVVAAYALLVLAICFAIDIVRGFVLQKPEALVIRAEGMALDGLQRMGKHLWNLCADKMA